MGSEMCIRDSIQVIPKRGRKGRHRWLAQDKRQQNMTVGMSPRDWETAKDAVTAGEELLEARARPLREKCEKLAAQVQGKSNRLTEAAQENGRLLKEIGKLQRQRDQALEGKESDHRAVVSPMSSRPAWVRSAWSPSSTTSSDVRP